MEMEMGGAGWVDGWCWVVLGGWMGGWVDGWMGGWVDGWMGGWWWAGGLVGGGLEGGWHLVSKRDGQHVTLTPVEEVKVEVVEELGRVEDALGLRRDVPPALGRQAGRAVVPVHGTELIKLAVQGRRRLRREGEDLARSLAAEERVRQLLSVRELLDVLTRWRGVRVSGVLGSVRDLKV